jgi:hypothetical protein
LFSTQSSQSYPRSLVRTFSIKALDHAPQLFNLDFTFSVFPHTTARSCPWQILVPWWLFEISHSSLSYHVADHLSLANNSLLQMHPLLANIIDLEDHRLLRFHHLNHEYRPSALSRQHLVYQISSLSLSASFNRAYTLSLVFPYATDSVTPLHCYPMVSSIHQLRLSHPRSLSSCRCP